MKVDVVSVNDVEKRMTVCISLNLVDGEIGALACPRNPTRPRQTQGDASGRRSGHRSRLRSHRRLPRHGETLLNWPQLTQSPHILC